MQSLLHTEIARLAAEDAQRRRVIRRPAEDESPASRRRAAGRAASPLPDVFDAAARAAVSSTTLGSRLNALMGRHRLARDARPPTGRDA